MLSNLLSESGYQEAASHQPGCPCSDCEKYLKYIHTKRLISKWEEYRRLNS